MWSQIAAAVLGKSKQTADQRNQELQSIPGPADNPERMQQGTSGWDAAFQALSQMGDRQRQRQQQLRQQQRIDPNPNPLPMGGRQMGWDSIGGL